MATSASKTSKPGSTKTSKTTGAAAKPAAKPVKAAATKAAAKPVKAAAKAVPAKAVASKAAPPRPKAADPKPVKAVKRPAVTPDQRRCYVEVAAYYIAERRGFSGGSAADDWLRAEAEVERLLAEGLINP